MKPTEQELLIADLLKLNKSEKMYSEETVINIIKQVLKMQSPNLVSESGQKTECYPPEFVEWIRKLTAPMNFMSNYHLFKFWQETINK